MHPGHQRAQELVLSSLVWFCLLRTELCACGFKLEEDKNQQLSKGLLDPWSNNPTAASAAATSTLHYLLHQEKERAQAQQEQLQIYHQQGFSYLQHHHHHQRQQQQQPPQSRAAAAGAGAAAAGGGGDGVSSGESTPMDALATAFGGGRIVRSAAGRKDRHSKVCTARGLRDRRVRLAAHTAIRFYDVQDRLGYDRPSKAVDWLIRNAKSAIDDLPDREEGQHQQPAAATAEAAAADVHATTEPAADQATSTSYAGFVGNPIGDVAAGGSFIAHSVGNVKSLFPSSSTASTTPTHQDEYCRGSPPDLLSRTTSTQQHQTQELCLTLQPNNHHHQIFSHVSSSPNHHHGMISGAGVQAGWPEHAGQRMPPPWHHASENSSAGDGRGNNNGDSYMFGVPTPRQGLDHHQASGQLFSQQQGEPLQSSGGWPASARTWLDPLAVIHQPSTMAGQVGFSHLVGAAGGFMGFLAPAAAHQRLQDEEEHGSEAMRE